MAWIASRSQFDRLVAGGWSAGSENVKSAKHDPAADQRTLRQTSCAPASLSCQCGTMWGHGLADPILLNRKRSCGSTDRCRDSHPAVDGLTRYICHSRGWAASPTAWLQVARTELSGRATAAQTQSRKREFALNSRYGAGPPGRGRGFGRPKSYYHPSTCWPCIDPLFKATYFGRLTSLLVAYHTDMSQEPNLVVG